MATPTFVQSVCGPSTAGNAITKYVFRFEHATQANNLINIFGQMGTNDVEPTSITDDVGNTYTSVGKTTDTSQTAWCWRSYNSTAGARVITVNMASASYVTCMAQEWYNVKASGSPNDGYTGNSGSGTALTANSGSGFTPGTNGDLILCFGIQDTGEARIASWAAGTSFTLVNGCADIFDSTVCEYYVQPTAALINPGITMGTSKNWICIAVAFLNDTAGTARPSGIRSQACAHLSLTGVAANDGCSASPRTFQFPCSGNLLAIRWNSPDGPITAVSDSHSNTWTVKTAVSDLTDGNSGYNQVCYAENATTSADTTITITYSANDSSSGDTCMVNDIIGAATAPFDQYTTSHGDMTSGLTLGGNQITPATGNGLILTVLGVDSASAAGLTGVLPGVFTSIVLTPQPGTSPVDQNNGYACELNSGITTSQSQWTMTAFCKSWAEATISFKAPGGTSALTGTVTAAITETDVVAGGKTIILTATGDSYVPAAGGAISYVGAQGAGFAGTTSAQTINFALTQGLAAAPVTGDLVLIAYTVGSTADRSLAIRNTSAVDYELLGSELYVDDTFDCNLRVAYRFMPSPTETQFVLTETVSGGTGNVADAGRYTVHVFRGVDTGTTIDVAVVTATGTSSRVANPGSIEPATAGSIIYAVGAAACATGGTYTASYLIDFRAGSTADTNDAQIGAGYYIWSSGAYDPAAFSGGGTTTTNDSWAAVTVALRPAATTPFADSRAAIAAGIDSAQAEATGWDAKVKPNIPVANIVRTSSSIVTVTLQAQADYNITAQETITVTVPAAALVGNVATVSSPTFTVATSGGGGPVIPVFMNQYRQRRN